MIPEFACNFSLELLLHISSPLPNKSSICLSHVKLKLDSASLQNSLLPACLPVKLVIQSFELDTWLWSGIHLSPSPSPLISKSFQFYHWKSFWVQSHFLLPCHCLVVIRGLILFFLHYTGFFSHHPTLRLSSLHLASYPSESINLILPFICLKIHASSTLPNSWPWNVRPL